MKTVLITGGSGFFGSLLKRRLLNADFYCVNIDLCQDMDDHRNLKSICGDIRDYALLEKLFNEYTFDAVFHCAAILAHAVKDKEMLWTSNVDGTNNIARLAEIHGVKRIIFTSSNCLWGYDMQKIISEDDVPQPVEIYGKSKLAGEKLLLQCRDRFHAIIFRCPTIIDSGRLGLLAMLFQFIDEGRKVWIVGNGENRYQFIYAGDLVDACCAALNCHESDIFNIGSDNVKTFKEIYSYIVTKANTGSRVAHLPKRLAIMAMKLFYLLKISPLGPYQYNMIAGNFIFDTTKIKTKLNWKPSLSNEEMLYKAYEYYRLNRMEIENRKNVSAHKKSTKMGVIKILKWLS